MIIHVFPVGDGSKCLFIYVWVLRQDSERVRPAFLYAGISLFPFADLFADWVSGSEVTLGSWCRYFLFMGPHKCNSSRVNREAYALDTKFQLIITWNSGEGWQDRRGEGITVIQPTALGCQSRNTGWWWE